ncbi:CMRF35-like molecule 6 [Patagioenas fasciata]|uniref:CMRF35-like molecule 6 n=1 Tax=Patagioenas fasciata TaxID=372321 RepID=UPI003A995F75
MGLKGFVFLGLASVIHRGAVLRTAPGDLVAKVVETGCWAVRGPSTVRGFLGRSLSVTCVYEPSEEMEPKFWCKPGKVYTCAYHIIITSEEQPMVQEGRFSIWDNRALRVFRVTVEGLVEGEVGTYPCGVQRGKIQRDKSADVVVILSPGQSLNMFPSPHSTRDHHVARSRTGLREEMVPGFWWRERDKGEQCLVGTCRICPLFPFAGPTLSPVPAEGTDAPRESPDPFRHVPVLAGLQVLALLAMTGAVLWVSLRSG